MAIFAATDTKVTLASTDWSDWVTSATLQIDVAELPSTAFGDTWEERIGGLKKFSLALTFHQDFVDNGIDETLWNALGTSVAFTVNPTSAANGAANPAFTGSVLINSLQPINASVGDLATFQVTWPGTGALTRVVA